MASEFKLRYEIPFGDTDMAGIVHFPNYYKYMENCEHAFFRSLGFTIHKKNENLGWPRVYSECKYIRPLFFEDEIEIHLMVHELDKKRITYLFHINKKESGKFICAAKGVLKVASVCFSDGKLESIDMPDRIFEQLDVYKEEK